MHMPMLTFHSPHEVCARQVGEDLQAFSDFLFFAIFGANALLTELAVAVFDATSGAAEVFRGAHYPDPYMDRPSHPDPNRDLGGGGDPRTQIGDPSAGLAGSAARRGGMSEEHQRANLLCLMYLPGHYQALVATREAHGEGGRGPTLAELLGCLDVCGVRYVLTDG